MRLRGRDFGPVSLLLAAVAINACTILPESPPQDVFRLPPSAIEARDGGTDMPLRIARPSAGDVLNSVRIAVVPEGNRLSVYEGVRWSSPAPVLWRDQLLDAFRKDGRVERLSSGGEGLRADFELGGALRAFQTEYREGKPEVIIHFDARLVDTGGRRIVASRRFAATAKVAGDQVPAVVEAFGRATDALASQLIDWTVQHMRQNTP